MNKLDRTLAQLERMKARAENAENIWTEWKIMALALGEHLKRANGKILKLETIISKNANNGKNSGQ